MLVPLMRSDGQPGYRAGWRGVFIDGQRPIAIVGIGKAVSRGLPVRWSLGMAGRGVNKWVRQVVRQQSELTSVRAL